MFITLFVSFEHSQDPSCAFYLTRIIQFYTDGIVYDVDNKWLL